MLMNFLSTISDESQERKSKIGGADEQTAESNKKMGQQKQVNTFL
jgi:hypothetical protein